MPLPFLTGFGRDILNASPEDAFFGRVSRLGSNRVQEHFRGQFGDIYDQFIGSQGNDFFFDRAPQFLEFPDYLENFDFQNTFNLLSPAARGETPSRFAPRIQFS